MDMRLGTKLAVGVMVISLCVGGLATFPGPMYYPPYFNPSIVLDEPIDPADEIRLLGVYTITTNLGFGSGFSISDTIIVTAEHVIRGADTIFVDGEAAALIVADPIKDVAILRVPSRPRPHLKFADAARGDEVRAVGYAAYNGEGWPMITEGRVAGFAEGYVTVTGGIGPGMSGGPLLDTEGRVVGLASHAFSWQRRGTPNPTLANFTPSQWILTVLAGTPL